MVFIRAKLGTHRAQALGDRALPDLMAAANAADPEKEPTQASVTPWTRYNQNQPSRAPSAC